MKPLALALMISACAFGQKSGGSGSSGFSSIASQSPSRVCLSVAAASLGDWRSMLTAPRDGTVIEVLETYGYAPWFGLFKYDRTWATFPYWKSVDQVGTGLSTEDCAFWRPYKGTGKYVDPTGGLQNKVAFTCLFLHLPYNKRKDACE